MASRSGLSQSGEDNFATSDCNEKVVKVDDGDIDMRMVKRPRSVEPVREDIPKIAKTDHQNGDDLSVTQTKSCVNAMPNQQVNKASDQPSSSTSKYEPETKTKEPRPRSASKVKNSSGMKLFYDKKKLKDYGESSPTMPFTPHTNIFKFPNTKQLSKPPNATFLRKWNSHTPLNASKNKLLKSNGDDKMAKPLRSVGEKPFGSISSAMPLPVGKLRPKSDIFECNESDPSGAWYDPIYDEKKRSFRELNMVRANPLRSGDTSLNPTDDNKTVKILRPVGQKPWDTSIFPVKKPVNAMASKEVKHASPPSTSTTTSKDKVETMDQKLQEQSQLHESEQIEDDEEVENLRTNFRKQYIELIETTNSKLFAKEQDLTFNDINRDDLKNNLKERQVIEKGDVEIKFQKEVTDLEQKVAEQEKQLSETKKKLAATEEKKRKELKEIHKKHRDETAALDNKLGKDQEHDKNAVAKLKERTNKLAQDLRNLVQDPTKDKATLEAVKATLECPICMELMKPPTKIWMCSSNHIVCEPCRDKLKGRLRLCPTCRTEKVALRALLAENFARTVFNEVIAEPERKTHMGAGASRSNSEETDQSSPQERTSPRMKKEETGVCPSCQRVFWVSQVEKHLTECKRDFCY